MEQKANSAQPLLHYAAGNNDNPAIIDTLLEAGADIKARNEVGSNPFAFGCRIKQKSRGDHSLVAGGGRHQIKRRVRHNPFACGGQKITTTPLWSPPY